jgi:HlyD family secretion protein
MNGNSLKRLLNSNGRRILLFSVGGAVLAAVVITALILGRAGGSARSGLYTLKKGTLRIVVTEEGVLAAKDSEKIVADVQAQAKIVWIIDEGSFVNKGDKLVELDKTRLEELLESLQTDLISLEVNYTQSEEDLRKYENAEYPQQLKELKFNVVKAQSRLEKALEQQPKPEHVEQGLYSKGELRDAQLAVQEAQMNVETAELALEVFEKYTHPRKMLELNANLDRAKRLYEKQKEQEAEVSEQLDKMVMYAPSDGLVVYGSGSDNWRRSSRDTDIEVGADVYKGQIVITLPNVSKMQAAIKIHEMDFLKVKKGLPATVTVHALHKTFAGKVSTIGALAHERDGWRTQGVKVFDVSIDIEGTYTELRPGMMARVDLLVSEIPDALLVPVEAVFPEPAKHGQFCWVRTPTGPQKRAVKLGASSNSFTIITEGLKEGDQVYQYDPTAKAE